MSEERKHTKGPCAVPLVELLASVPVGARFVEKVAHCHHRNHPVGRLCGEAAIEIARLSSELDALAAQNAELVEVIDNDDLRDAAAYFRKEAIAERVLLSMEKGNGSRIALGQYERYEAAIRAALAKATTPTGEA